MKRPVLAGLLLASVAALILLVAVMRTAVHRNAEPPAAVKNITVSIDGRNFDLRDGVAEKQSAAGSATRDTARVVGEPVIADATGNGARDAALLIANDPGGSGTFYYAVLAVDHDGAYHATNAIPLGDRIVPRGVDFADGHFVYRFLERKPDEPMAAPPTAERTVVITLDPATGRITPGS